MRSVGMAALCACAAIPAARAAEPARSAFGTLPDGRTVEEVTLANGHGVTARVLSWGALLQTLDVPDRAGKPADVVLGYDDLAGYLAKPNYFGVTVGRYANRIARRPLHPRRPDLHARHQRRPERPARRDGAASTSGSGRSPR